MFPLSAVVRDVPEDPLLLVSTPPAEGARMIQQPPFVRARKSDIDLGRMVPKIASLPVKHMPTVIKVPPRTETEAQRFDRIYFEQMWRDAVRAQIAARERHDRQVAHILWGIHL